MITLTKIKIKNYKGFKNFIVDFLNENILVGKNNAGKSTIGEAIRLVSLATSSYKTAHYDCRPEWLENEPLVEKGFFPSKKRTDIVLNNPIYQFENDIAIIEAFFSNKTSLKIFINSSSEIFIKVFNGKNCIATNYVAKNTEIPIVKSLPSLKPLLDMEKVHDKNYVLAPYNEKNLSIHFRNRLLLLKNEAEKFSSFCDAVINSWPGITIGELNTYEYENGFALYLSIRDEDFVSEISGFGSGLQIWLQIIYFISSLTQDTIVFLDEPDVYLHADLQKKLFELIKSRFNQFIIATHSVEIICEADRKSIVEVNKRKSKSERNLDLNQIQNIFDELGSYANIKFQSIMEHKKILFLEGNEISWLKQVASRIYKMPFENFDIPYEKSGGRSNIKEKIISLQNDIKHMKDLDIDFYFLVDNDYYNVVENDLLEKFAREIDVKLHIWKRKEIENYFCDPNLIYSSISNENIGKDQVFDLIDKVTNDMKQEYILKVLDMETRFNKRKESSTIYRKIEAKVNSKWHDLNYRLEILSGKEVIGKIFEKLKLDYNISLSIDKIIQNMDIKELNSEFVEYIKEIF